METPERIVLIDVGDEVTWRESIPSVHIEDYDVVNYVREDLYNESTRKLKELYTAINELKI